MGLNCAAFLTRAFRLEHGKDASVAKGNASKDDVVAAMVARGFAPSSSDEADALSILHWAIATNGGIDG